MILDKRLSSFFETHYQSERNEKIQKAVSYGYSKTEVAQYVGLNKMAIFKIVKKGEANGI